MIEAAKTVTADLQAATALQAEISGAHFWELAPENQAVPFITYRIRENKRPSKDKGGNYDLEVFCWHNGMMAAAELAELAREALISANYRFLAGESGYSDQEGKEGFIKMSFNFNL